MSYDYNIMMCNCKCVHSASCYRYTLYAQLLQDTVGNYPETVMMHSAACDQVNYKCEDYYEKEQTTRTIRDIHF